MFLIPKRVMKISHREKKNSKKIELKSLGNLSNNCPDQQ